MKLPERLYYPLPEAAERLGCSIKDIIHYGAIGALNISMYIEFSVEDNKRFLHLSISDEKVKEISEFSNIHGDGWNISGVDFYEKQENDLGMTGYYARGISGFFYISPHDLVPIEFDSSKENIKLFYMSTGIDEDDGSDNIEINCMMYGITVPVKNLCVMAKNIDEISEDNKISMPSFEITQKKTRKPNENKQSQFIKALIEIHYSRDESEDLYSLMKDGSKDNPPGELLKDFELKGIRLPAGFKTVKGWLDGVELDRVEISSSSKEITKK